MSIGSNSGDFVVESKGPEETARGGERLGGLVQGGDVICLTGTLGAGKTVFVKGIAAGMGVNDPRTVTSPSFTLINRYDGCLALYHVDAFRLDDSTDLEELGSDEMFYGDGVVAVEWADRVEEALPKDRLDVVFTVVGPSSRKLEFAAKGERARKLLGIFASQLRG